MKIYNKILSISILVVLCITLIPANVYAAVGSYSAGLGATTITVGKTTNVIITATKSAGKFTVTTSNASVATVSTSSVFVDGLEGTKSNSSIIVKGINAGTATITVTPIDVSDSEYNLLTAPKSITITVKEEVTNNNSSNNTNNSNSNNNSGKTNTDTNSNKATTTNTKSEEKTTDTNKKSSDASLKSVTLGKGEMDFKSDVTKYTVDVDKTVNSLGLKAVATDSKASVDISGDQNFKVGNNTVKITVTAEDGTTKVYEITVIKSKFGSGPLKDLKVKGYSFDKEFDPSIHQYSVDVKDATSVEVEYKLTKDTSTAKVSGDKNLKEGLNKVEVKVTEKDGTVTVYTINVNNTISTKDITEKNNTTWIAIIIILSVLLVIETIYILLKNKKANK